MQGLSRLPSPYIPQLPPPPPPLTDSLPPIPSPVPPDPTNQPTNLTLPPSPQESLRPTSGSLSSLLQSLAESIGQVTQGGGGVSGSPRGLHSHSGQFIGLGSADQARTNERKPEKRPC
ncbi:hypothetical protein Pcinc_042482 [Petrolisthes cinctipes]|uniref:Uncharacterized protein n=1 Tax=Petrolisthes cinctipes TaxID=88211 RepID=A0AAE1BHF5_PETCI|nr:hypothetical protein Pcinc_042482 [Petrolisthes cinctipes]